MLSFIPHDRYYPHFIGEGVEVQRVLILETDLLPEDTGLNTVLNPCIKS